MTTVAIVQARVGSTRFPNKVMKQVCGTPLIGLLLERLSGSELIDQVVLATSTDPRNQPLSEYVSTLGYTVYQGSEDDVLDRYYQAARAASAETVVRITGDCPLIDPALLDAVIRLFRDADAEFASNGHPPTYPNGLDVGVCSFKALEAAWNRATAPYDREHVTPFISDSGSFRAVSLQNEEDLSGERWTVDEPEDLEVVTKIFEHFAPRRDFSWQEIMQLRHSRPEYFAANRHIVRNEGSMIGTGQKLWKRAKRVIPGGNIVLAKRSEAFLPVHWPAYFSKAEGCRVWDLDGRELIDMSMGSGINTLGYGHPEVDEAVRQAIAHGNASTLNCPEEVHLAESLIELHPWAEMAYVAGTPGEANATTLRIARAASGRDGVAICEGHGWNDWDLAANPRDEKNLGGNLLAGIESKGVPRTRTFLGTVRPFSSNHFGYLEALVRQHPDIGGIVIDVSRVEGPQDGFLAQVRHLATEHGIVLVFDECTSAFRETFGGLHKKYGVEPDMAVFGGAMGNGYAVAAIIGRREVMEAAQKTFVSGTFWSDRIGPAAALATMQVMEQLRSWEIITDIGHDLKHRWQALADHYGIAVDVWGLPARAGFTIRSSKALAYKTLVTQEMLASGFLTGNRVCACVEHRSAVLDRYFEALESVFELVSECESGRNVMELLKGPVSVTDVKHLS